MISLTLLLAIAAFILAVVGTAMNSPRIIGSAVIILSAAVLLTGVRI